MLRALSCIFLLFTIISSVESQISRCPSYGKLNFTCSTFDYCNDTAGLICGDGSCGQTCPSGWNISDTYCYIVRNVATNFTVAQSYCRSLSADLVTMKDNYKLELVKQWLIQAGLNGTVIWLSAIEYSYGVYQWPDGSFLQYNNSMWFALQPDYSGLVEFNLALRVEGKFADRSINQAYKYICEKEAKPCVSTACQCKRGYYYSAGECLTYKGYEQSCQFSYECNPVSELTCINSKCLCSNLTRWYVNTTRCQKCPSGWLHSGKSCYALIKNANAYNTSDQNCKKYGASLIKIDNATEFYEINTIFRTYFNSSNQIWIAPLIFNGDTCFNMVDIGFFPTQVMWCPDSYATYEYNSCTYLRSDGGDLCISFYSNCSSGIFSMCEAEQFFVY